jgi:hypothetical protein
MTTIKDIAGSCQKKILLQASKLPNNQKIKKLGAMKSLFGYSFFLCFVLGIVSPFKVNADEVSYGCRSDRANVIFNSGGEVIDKISPSRPVYLESYNGVLTKFRINLQGGYYYTVYRLNGNNYELEKYNNAYAYIEVSSCDHEFSAAPFHATRNQPPRTH